MRTELRATEVKPELLKIQELLSLPFKETEIKFKPQIVKGNRAMALTYVDVRVIMERLDDVLGFENWQDDYEILADNSVMCKLSIRVAGEWIMRKDVGSPSEQPDNGDRLKAAVSDSLKRAAVKYGVGRYLYRLPQTWCDYDATKKQFVSPPKLPAWALPSGSGQRQQPTNNGQTPRQDSGNQKPQQQTGGAPNNGVMSLELEQYNKALNAITNSDPRLGVEVLDKILARCKEVGVNDTQYKVLCGAVEQRRRELEPQNPVKQEREFYV